jgi:hypothetical protein
VARWPIKGHGDLASRGRQNTPAIFWHILGERGSRGPLGPQCLFSAPAHGRGRLMWGEVLWP